jgi:hypothetical protein
MKNIHVLPTDEPSRLIIYSTLLNEFRLLDEPIDDWKHKRNIYITSDEKIKEGDWFLWQGYGGEWFKEKCEYMLYEGKKTKHLNCNYKTQFKVILTTDQDLIADGVQAIDDDFLEWFVKNPSCECVEVEKQMLCDYCGQEYCDNFRCRGYKDSVWYEIIIPREEPKQFIDCKCTNALQAENCTRNCGHGEEPKQETLEEAKQEQKQHLIDLMRLDEQETLEEAAKYYAHNYFEMHDTNNYKALKQGFEAGAKWQQEQDKNKYSKEEVLDLLYKRDLYLLNRDEEIDLELPDKWFDQFKKK